MRFDVVKYCYRTGLSISIGHRTMSGKIRVMSDENCLTKDTAARREVDDTHRKKLCFTQFSTRMAAWLFPTFFIYLYNQFKSMHSITRIKSTDV